MMSSIDIFILGFFIGGLLVGAYIMGDIYIEFK